MRKLYMLFLLTIVASITLKATTYTSSQNGNWTNPTTWSPLGVPLPGDIAIINHAVILNTDFAYTVGSITVNSSGSLVQDITPRALWVNGVNASLTNNGTTTINTLLLSAGSYSNSGMFNVKIFGNYITVNNTATGTINGLDSMFNDGIFNNNGTFKAIAFFNENTFNNYGTVEGVTTVLDSMVNNGTFLNEAGALLKADSCTNAAIFTNNGVVNFDQFTNIGTLTNNNYMSFGDITNAGIYINKDSLIGYGDMTNADFFDNQSGAFFNLAIGFLNYDINNNDAVFNNDGTFDVGDSFYNFDTITGGNTGRFTVQDTSYNHTTGVMSGSFDFCDMTPPATPIKIDFNLGSVDNNITYCLATSVTDASANIIFSIYPNPTTGVINIELENVFSVDIYNVLGEKIITTANSKIDIRAYQNGVYFVLIKDETGSIVKQKKIVKH